MSVPTQVRLLRRSTRCCGGGARRSTRSTGAGSHEIFLKLLKAKREVPGAAERQKPAQNGKRAVRLRADGHLRAGPRGAGKTGLCGQRADFVGAVRRLPQQEDAEGERAAHEFEELVVAPFSLPILCPADGAWRPASAAAPGCASAPAAASCERRGRRPCR